MRYSGIEIAEEFDRYLTDWQTLVLPPNLTARLFDAVEIGLSCGIRTLSGICWQTLQHGRAIVIGGGVSKAGDFIGLCEKAYKERVFFANKK